MYRFINFVLLARVCLPFLFIYYAYHRLKQHKGPLHQIYSQIKEKIPGLESLSIAQTKRIYHYIFANSLTTQWFATLLNYRASATEKMTGYFLAVSTPLADYLVDEEKIRAQEIIKMISGKSNHLWQALSQTLFEKSKINHPNPDLCEELIFKTLQAQEESLGQQQDPLSLERLKAITWAKGGYALLLYRSALNHPISKLEWSAIFQLGGLMQLHNDIFDLYRDIQEGINTIPSQMHSVDALSKLFSQEIATTYHMFQLLPISTYRKRKFFLLLNLAVNTGHICIAQYLQLEIKYQHFTPKEFTRKELVCDMDDLGKIGHTIWKTINTRF
jgi:hypothetical protein